FDYVYIDSTNNELQKNNKPVNHQAGVLAHTLNPYHSADVLFLIITCALSCSCSAGVVMMDKENVVWLLHSTPKFPNGDESNNFFPESGETKAQIFMCVTLKSTESAQIGKSMSKLFLHHLKDINAHIFKEHNPEKLKDSSKEQRKRPYHKDLSSAGSLMFVFPFAEGDLYFYIADTLESNLYIQTWRSNPEDTDITDENQNLYNIVEVKAGGSKWEYRSDHSKWCVSDSKAWMCIGDSNREPSQFERPGGALCINSKHVANVKLFWLPCFLGRINLQNSHCI
uniref:deoxyribonuclease II n=1 Tax=Neolamprologus brichardi TaxID=32507 RepID=A0A3Q4N7T0_NEOBR